MPVKIEKWIDSGKDLPVLSETSVTVLKLLADHDSTARQIGDVIKRDVSLSATILKFCNSSFYGFRKKINTLEQAFVTLGSNRHWRNLNGQETAGKLNCGDVRLATHLIIWLTSHASKMHYTDPA